MIGSTLFAAVSSACKTDTFLGFKPWYAYLNVSKDSVTGTCTVQKFTLLPTSTSPRSDVPLVLLAVIDDLLRLAGLVAVIFVIYGAIQYVTSQGQPEEASKAQNTIQNALIGLVVAIIAVSVVSFLGRRLTQ